MTELLGGENISTLLAFLHYQYGTRKKPSWCWHTRATQNDEKNSSISKL